MIRRHEHRGCLRFAADIAAFVGVSPEDVHETRWGIGAELDEIVAIRGRPRQWCVEDERLHQLRAAVEVRAKMKRADQLYDKWRQNRVPPELRGEVSELVRDGYLKIRLNRL